MCVRAGAPALSSRQSDERLRDALRTLLLTLSHG